jgi:hypothetical protein
MKNLSDIENAIENLPESDARQLAEWLQKYLDDLWDRKMVVDLESGRLDSLIAKAEANIEANQIKDLNEILDNS